MDRNLRAIWTWAWTWAWTWTWQELASKGLDTKGNKSELVDRLSGHEAGLTPANVDARLGTLVVCPMSVLTNWETQLAEHVKEGALDVREGGEGGAENKR